MVWFPPQERATAIGVNQAAVNVSGILGAAIMPALALSVGWQAGFLVAAAMAFAVAGLAAAVYRDPPGGVPGWPAGAASPAVCEIEQGLPCVTGDEQADRAAVRPGFLAVARSRDILLLGLAAMFLCMVEFAALAHLVLYLHLDWAYSVVAAAGLLALCQAAGVTAAIDNIGIFVGPPLFGLIVDRSGSYAPAWWTMVGAAVLAACLLALVREPRRA